MVKKAFSITGVILHRSDGTFIFRRQGDLSAHHDPAFLKKIPIVILNTFDTAFAGTYIRHNVSPSNLPIKGISSINEVSIINLEGSGMVGKAGFSGRLFSMLAREQISVILITQSSSEHSITFAIPPADAVKALHLIEQEFELELQAKNWINRTSNKTCRYWLSWAKT